VVIQTKQKDSETGWCLEYDRQGTLFKQTKIQKNPGTSVSVREMFSLLPVRLSEFKKSHKTQFARCVSLLQQYGVISTHCKITVSNN